MYELAEERKAAVDRLGAMRVEAVKWARDRLLATNLDKRPISQRLKSLKQLLKDIYYDISVFHINGFMGLEVCSYSHS